MISISTQNFSQKPSSDEIKKISYIRKDMNIDDIVNCIQNGYVFSANFNEDYTTTITQSDRRYDNFISTAMVMYDLDGGIDCSLKELIGSLKYIPTVAYTTFSHQKEGKGNRYRLMYLFENPIDDKDIYKSIYEEIKNSFEFKLEDNCGKNPCQAIFGSSSDCEIIVTNQPYSVKDFSIVGKCHSNTIRKEERNIIEIESHFKDEEYKYDYFHLPYMEIIEKYKDKYPFFEHTPLHADNEDIPYILLPKNYIAIKRYWISEKVKDENDEERWQYIKPKKIKDGEGRRRKLFINGILRRMMMPDISFEHLLNCLAFELYHFVENNNKDPIKKKDLVQIATNAMNADVSAYNFEQTDKRKYIVNDAYCRKYHISKREARNISRKIRHYEQIGEMYDASLTDADNIEVFKQNGLCVSLRTLKRFRKDMGLMKYKENNKQNLKNEK